MTEQPVDSEPGWVHGHAHEPNPPPPEGDGSFVLHLSEGEQQITVADLRALAHTVISDCYIVSTGHGSSGPFAFGGVRLIDLIDDRLGHEKPWRYVDVIGRDGFGARLTPADLAQAPARQPVLLAYDVDGAPLSHPRGLVRLIVPTETNDALKQVKWIGRIEVV